MEPVRTPPGTIVDLLDRVLDKGLVLNADLIISLAGVPLIGVNLRATLAGMETMVRYGIMEEWDQRIRLQEQALRDEEKSSRQPEEKIILEMPDADGCRTAG